MSDPYKFLKKNSKRGTLGLIILVVITHHTTGPMGSLSQLNIAYLTKEVCLNGYDRPKLGGTSVSSTTVIIGGNPNLTTFFFFEKNHSFSSAPVPGPK